MKTMEWLLQNFTTIFIAVYWFLVAYVICVFLFKIMAYNEVHKTIWRSQSEKDCVLAWIEANLLFQPFAFIVLLSRKIWYRHLFVKEAIKEKRELIKRESYEDRRRYEERYNVPKWNENIPQKWLNEERQQVKKESLQSDCAPKQAE